MSFELHEYQKKCLEDLRHFFDRTAEIGARKAFFEITDHDHGKYRPPPKMLESTPYVCIRVPTGGGKTLMAAHAVGIAAKRYSETELPVCLWLAPSGAIVSQTLNSLQNREHPCRIALADAFHGRNINCISIKQALRISRADLESGATIIVATIQSLRQEKTEGLKIYEDNGNLMEHFDSISTDLHDELRRDEDGAIHQSLDNALQLRRPIIISDEAHNSGTDLSYESLARFNPSCIVEFTATPQTTNEPKKGKQASNVLTQSSAFQLKGANMIKFPLHLEVMSSAGEALRAAISKRDELEKSAKKAEEYIRPIVLYQAEDKDGKTTVEVIEESLQKVFAIPKEQIAVQTGTRKELQNLDLLSSDCPVRHIITVRALAEGWDCPFAYVLCSMANFESPRPVEQVLGRILRLPYASPKKEKALNECYAYVAKGNFYTVAHSLKDALVNKSGFQRIVAEDFISSKYPVGSLFRSSSELAAKEDMVRRFEVPLLAVNEKGKQQPLEFEHFLNSKWSIAKEKPQVSDFNFPVTAHGAGVLDVDKKGEITVQPKEVSEVRGRSMLLDVDKKWTEESLVAWLDEEIKHLDIPQMQSVPYIYGTVKELCKKHKLIKLARYRFDVRNHLEEKIKNLRNKKRSEGYQQMLKNMKTDTGKLQVSAKHVLTLERRKYEPHWECENAPFEKHLHLGVVGELKNEGEEWECANYLNQLSEVEVWVRNLDKRNHSFWLQTSTDKFYPDFVCLLNDKRILVVEYKGEDRWSNDDSKEKRAIGKIWAELSGGKCLFIMPKGKDLRAIKKLLEDNPKKKK